MVLQNEQGGSRANEQPSEGHRCEQVAVSLEKLGDVYTELESRSGWQKHFKMLHCCINKR